VQQILAGFNWQKPNAFAGIPARIGLKISGTKPYQCPACFRTPTLTLTFIAGVQN
jgi:hypothetical protein